MIFDCVNEALNHTRPYGIKGNPFPWSSKQLKLNEFSSYDLVFQTAREIMKTWENIRSGSCLFGDRDARLNDMIIDEIINYESDWIDYEDEETQVSFDISDLITEHLIEEVIGFLIK